MFRKDYQGLQLYKFAPRDRAWGPRFGSLQGPAGGEVAGLDLEGRGSIGEIGAPDHVRDGCRQLAEFGTIGGDPPS